ncbi:MAG: AI-2E family transporter [Amphiplicatus sp.]
MAEQKSQSAVILGGQARAFFALALAVLIGFVAYVGRGVIIPIIVAIFVSFLIYTLKETIQKGPLVGRFLPGWICYLLAFAAIGSIFILLIDIIRDNIETLIAEAPLYEERLRALTRDGLDQIRALGAPEELLGGVEELRQKALELIRPILAQIGTAARALTGNFVTIFLYTVFMLLERGRIFKKIDLLSADEQGRRAVNEAIGDIGALVRDYITVKTVSNLVTAGLSYVIMRVVGVDFAGFWALLIFVFNFIPIIGAISAISAPTLLSLVQPDGGVQTALLTLVLLVGVEQMMSSVVEPRVVGDTLNLSPLVILFSLGVWGTIWGFAGLLLAVPITVSVMIILTQFPDTRWIAILLSDSGQIAPIKHPSLLTSQSEEA